MDWTPGHSSPPMVSWDSVFWNFERHRQREDCRTCSVRMRYIGSLVAYVHDGAPPDFRHRWRCACGEQVEWADLHQFRK